MKKLLFLLSLLYFANTQAQKTNNLYLSSGTSFAGSGDVKGFYIGTGIHYSKKRINFYYELATTIHNSTYTLYYNDNGRYLDGSVKTVSAGIQFSTTLSYSVIKSLKHNFNLGVGPLVRYQTTSVDGFEVQFPAFTGLSYPVIVMRNYNKLSTFSIAPNFQVAYQYNFYKKFSAGIRANLHFDTNGDIFWNKGLILSYKL